MDKSKFMAIVNQIDFFLVYFALSSALMVAAAPPEVWEYAVYRGLAGTLLLIAVGVFDHSALAFLRLLLVAVAIILIVQSQFTFVTWFFDFFRF